MKPVSTLSDLSLDSPFHSRFAAYLAERFPIRSYFVLILSYYSSNQFLAEALTHPDQNLVYNAGSLAGSIAILCMFFHLRVFDEHKDFTSDRQHYPDRILQRGIITLRTLKWFGGIAICVEILAAAAWMPAGKPAALVAVLIALGYSILMFKEFFAGEWLKQHFLIYTLLHIAIMPLFALVVFSFTTGQYPWMAPAWYWMYAIVGLLVTLNWEISRKIKSPEQEIKGVQSYSTTFGTYRAAWIVLLVRIIDSLMVSAVGWRLGVRNWFYLAIVLLFLVCLIGFLNFRFRTSAETAKQMEWFAGLYIIGFDLILALELVSRMGIEFRWWYDN